MAKYLFKKRYKGYSKGDIDNLTDKKEITFLLETETIEEIKLSKDKSENSFLKENEELKLENQKLKDDIKVLQKELKELKKE
ncbi:MAG: hypothetical protein ACRCY7_03295 [Cetobacterium sp.]|uniref:hypothetical protein n=1 Tax=Cetobacterium sp. TaxID=2071632 RepID=UPI003F2BD8A4